MGQAAAAEEEEEDEDEEAKIVEDDEEEEEEEDGKINTSTVGRLQRFLSDTDGEGVGANT